MIRKEKGICFVLFCFSILVRKHQTFHTLVDWSQTRMFAPKRVFTKVLFTHHGMHSIVQSITLKSIYNKIWVHPSMQFETHISCAKFQHKKHKSKSNRKIHKLFDHILQRYFGSSYLWAVKHISAFILQYKYYTIQKQAKINKWTEKYFIWYYYRLNHLCRTQSLIYTSAVCIGYGFTRDSVFFRALVVNSFVHSAAFIMATHFICSFTSNFSIFTQNLKMTCIINHFLQFLCSVRNAVAATTLLLDFYTVYSHFNVCKLKPIATTIA